MNILKSGFRKFPSGTIILILLLSFIPKPYQSRAAAAPTLVAGQIASVHAYAASISASFPSANSAGNFIIATIFTPLVTATLSITDTNNNTYTLASSYTDSNTNTLVGVFYAKNIASGSNTVTATATGSTNTSLNISEFSGIDTVNPLDVKGNATGYGGNPDVKITSTQGNDLIYGYSYLASGQASIASAFTAINGTYPGYIGEEYQVQSAAGMADISFINGNPGNGTWNITAVAFKASGSAPATDTIPPTAPTNLTATAASSSQINLSWTASTDDVSVTGYQIYRGPSSSILSLVGTVGAVTTYQDTGLSPSTTYYYTVKAADGAGLLSTQATVANATTSAVSQDTTAPSVPANLTATAASSSVINLSWTASTDPDNSSNQISYKIYRAGTQIATATTTSYSDTGLSASTAYSYTVSAYDPANNNSAQSSSASATTQAALSPGAYTVGWNDLANTHLHNVCPPNGFGNEISDNQPYAFNDNCIRLIYAWSGGIADTLRNRLLIWGGGHGDYGGNEVYSLNLGASPVSLTRLNNPSVPVYDLNATVNSPAAMPDGHPNSRHTAGGLAYMANLDKMFVFNGALAGNGNSPSHLNDTWTLDLSNLQWLRRDPVAGPITPASSGPFFDNAAYDPNTQSVFVDWTGYLFRYDYATNTYTYLNSGAVPANISGVIDPVRKMFFLIGSDYYSTPPANLPVRILAINIAPGSDYAVQDWTSQVTGCDGLGSPAPGVAYDNALNRIVGWPNNGNSVYIFNPDTKSCTTQTFAGGPPTAYVASTGGTFGRFQYFPSLDIFAEVNDANQDAYVLKLASSGPSDTTAPSVPANLTATAASSSVINLSWTASTDPDNSSNQISYKIYRAGTQIATATTTSYSDTGLSASTAYSYTVSAYDPANNNSAQSSSASATTQAAADTTAPTVSLTAPTSGATVNGKSINVTAVASDNVGVVGVQFKLDGTNLGAESTASPYSILWDTTTASNATHTLSAVARDAAGNTSTSSPVSVNVNNINTARFLLHGAATELSGTSNGSTVTPAIGPSGVLKVNGAGSVNFSTNQTGSGVYFRNCCNNYDNAYYQFSGSQIGNIFNVNKGEMDFSLTSRQTWAQRKSTPGENRYVLDVRDATNHQFTFCTYSYTYGDGSSNLFLSYGLNTGGAYYALPSGQEDALFGNGISMKIKVVWDGITTNLYVNGVLVKSTPYTPSTPSWSSASTFDLGAYEYSTFGGYNVSDDIIQEFSVQ